MGPTRRIPVVGHRGEIITLAGATPAEIVAVDGTRISVVGDDDEELVFELHRLTGHWVKQGDPYWGTRFRLRREQD